MKTKDIKTTNDSPMVYLGRPDPTQKNGVYAIRKAAIIGYPSFFLCHECGRPVIVIAENEGRFLEKCEFCNSKTIVRGIKLEKAKPNVFEDEKKPEKEVVTKNEKTSSTGKTASDIDDDITDDYRKEHKKVNAKIVWGGLFDRKSYKLKNGENWISRWDEGIDAEIMVKDKFMSKRSACIEVLNKGGQFVFKFTVHRSLNPVKVNNNIIESGQSIFLNYEDSIYMGKTLFIIKQIKK